MRNFKIVQMAGVVLLVWVGTALLTAQTMTPMGTMDPNATLPKPLALEAKDQIADNQKYDLPHPPRKDVDKQVVSFVNDEDSSPTKQAMTNLMSDDVLTAVLKLDKEQKDHGQYHWFTAGNWDYCHYRDGDRDWYGWKTGIGFHWVLFRHGFFWWRDGFAERWLYFYQGYWWWQNAKLPVQTQVFMDDKHYHVCDANGVLGADLWTTGAVQSITTPVVKPTVNATPGHHRGGGHRGGGGGMGGGTLPPAPSTLEGSD